MQGCYDPMDWFKEASGFDFEYSSNIKLIFLIHILISTT